MMAKAAVETIHMNGQSHSPLSTARGLEESALKEVAKYVGVLRADHSKIQLDSKPLNAQLGMELAQVQVQMET